MGGILVMGDDFEMVGAGGGGDTPLQTMYWCGCFKKVLFRNIMTC